MENLSNNLNLKHLDLSDNSISSLGDMHHLNNLKVVLLVLQVTDFKVNSNALLSVSDWEESFKFCMVVTQVMHHLLIITKKSGIHKTVKTTTLI